MHRGTSCKITAPIDKNGGNERKFLTANGAVAGLSEIDKILEKKGLFYQ